MKKNDNTPKPREAAKVARRALLSLGAGALGAVGLAREAEAHPTSLHDEPPKATYPDYGLAGRKLKNRGRGMDLKPLWEPTPPTNAPKNEDAYKRFAIDVRIVEHEFLPGIRANLLAFNNQVPGPLIRVNEGDWVRVDFKNDTDLMHTIHWHGIMVPENMDGVPFVTQPPTMPGQTFVYRFRATPYGTHFYHCHFGTPLHMHHAMHGAFIIESENDPVRRQFPYTREYTFILNQSNTAMARNGLNAMITRMRERIVLMRRKRSSDEVLARFDSIKSFLRAVKNGYVPPYKQSRRGPWSDPTFNMFTINGKAYPMTPKLRIKRDELIRVRIINVGSVEHYMHLHGHDFWEVCRDGAPLPHAFRANTLPVTPGRTHDIIIEGRNPGTWTFHDHAVTRATNNSIYPGGILTVLHYEDFTPEYPEKVALDE